MEAARRRRGYRSIGGIDEVGRGALAGPVVAAAVVLPEAWSPEGLDDSKRLSAKQRNRLCAEIRSAARVCVAVSGPGEIDRFNILNATMLAMRRAAEDLRPPADLLLVDGNRVPSGLSVRAEAVVGGDRVSASIAAASIIAKVHRDRLMDELAEAHSGFGWERNKGYGTKEHLNAIRERGPTREHRRSFAPVSAALAPMLAGGA